MTRTGHNSRREEKIRWDAPGPWQNHIPKLQKFLAKETVTRRKKKLRVVIYSLEGKLSADKIAGKVGVARATVFNDRNRYAKGGLKELLDGSAPGRPRMEMPRFLEHFFHALIRLNRSYVLIYVPRYLEMALAGMGYELPAWKLERWLTQIEAGKKRRELLPRARPTRDGMARCRKALKQGVCKIRFHRLSDKVVAVLPWPENGTADASKPT